MNMKKMFAGLIAFVAGVALSAGSALATKGYVGGDPAMMKLVPYYEAGDTKATIIGIQNLSPQEETTMAQHAAVMAARTALMTEQDEAAPDPTMLANLGKALEDAEAALMTEHLFVTVNVYDVMGMEVGSAELCLAEHQFGVVSIQGMSATMPNGHQRQTFSVMDDEIPANGYVEIVADGVKWSACDSASRSNRMVSIVTDPMDFGTADDVVTGAQSEVAAWTIIQDIGGSFFGTEVPTATISRSMVPGLDATDADNPAIAAGDPRLACYSSPVTSTDPGRLASDLSMIDPASPGAASNLMGNFMMSRCGLIPERHDNSRDAMGDLAIITGTDAADTDVLTATPRTHALARYDAGDESMVYVWLAEGMDTEKTHPSARRMLDVIVKCEDGTVMKGMDQHGDPMNSIKVPAPGMVTMIDPNGDELGDYTAMCEGDRGVLRITMPDKSTAGMVFSHITQMGGHYRMNFPGYSMANPDTCFGMGPAGVGDANGDGSVTAPEVGIDVDGDGDATGDEADLAAASLNACMAP